MAIPSLDELDEMPMEEVVARYNDVAGTTQKSASFYRGEIWRRRSAKREKEVKSMTKTMKNLTWAVFILTSVNVVLFALETLGG